MKDSSAQGTPMRESDSKSLESGNNPVDVDSNFGVKVTRVTKRTSTRSITPMRTREITPQRERDGNGTEYGLQESVCNK